MNYNDLTFSLYDKYKAKNQERDYIDLLFSCKNVKLAIYDLKVEQIFVNRHEQLKHLTFLKDMKNSDRVAKERIRFLSKWNYYKNIEDYKNNL